MADHRDARDQEDRDREAPGPWDDLTDELVDLTERLRSAYRRVSNQSGPSEEEIRHALQTLAAAWGQVAPSVGEVIRDEEVKAHLMRAASSLADAVGATFSELVPRPDEARRESG